MAAVLACGRTAALSHRSAACLFELLPHPARPGPIDVTTTAGHSGRHESIDLHRARALAGHEIRCRHGIPVTSPNRTILDLAGCATDAELEAAVAEAFAHRLTNRAALARAIVPGRRGAARLRALLDAGPRHTRSIPERRLLEAIRAAGLPEPLANHRIGPWEVDLYWPEHRLVVEVDGYAAHSSPRAFERDRRKDAELTAHGLTVQRFVAGRVDQAVDWIAARLITPTANGSPQSGQDGSRFQERRSRSQV
jgi:very-short-patch-repair endonuclease